MRSRFSKSGANGISFFAFQDIITGTTGVLIVITIFLALNLDEVITLSTDADPAAYTQEKLNEALEEVVTLKEQLDRLQVEPVEDEATLRRMVENLKASVSDLAVEQEAATGAPAAEETPLAREIRVERQNMMATLLRLKEEEEAAQTAAAEATRRLAGLETSVKDAESLLQQARDKDNTLRLIPQRSDTSKEPLLVIMQSGRLELRRFDQPTSDTVNSTSALLGLLDKFSPAGHYVVVYCKPSSASSFEETTDAVRSAGFEIGYDLMPEAIDLKFSSQ